MENQERVTYPKGERWVLERFRSLAACLVTGLLLVLPQARAEAGGIPISKPGCQQKCGGIDIPYPFGIGANCSLSSAFEMNCTDNTSFIRAEVILEISILKAQAQILTRPSQICTNYWSDWWLDLENTSLTISEKENRFIAIGCNTLALMKGRFVDTYTVGCLSTCPGGNSSKQIVDGSCSGIGCCQTSTPIGLKSYITALTDIISITFSNNDGANSTSTATGGYTGPGTGTGTGNCGYAFVAEKGNYTFQKAHLSSLEGRNFSVVADWSIGDQTCEEAQKNMTSYACTSSHSYCLNSTTGLGYVCKCSDGYQGNPHLQNGCQDINECNDKRRYPCYGDCQNLEGSYNCSCPLGTEGNATIETCRCPRRMVFDNTTDTCRCLPGMVFDATIDTCRCLPGTVFNATTNTCTPIFQAEYAKLKAALVVAIGIGSSFGLLVLAGIFALLYKKSKRQKLQKVRERHFQCNYDLLLQQQLLSSGQHENIVDTIKFFSLKDLEKATDKFDSSRVVGHGGHGTVYKGLIDLRVVAIKKSKVEIQIEIEQFLNEIILLSQISHRNVVKLIGCCLETEVPLLVYEFISNGTLSDHLHVWMRESTLSWDDRLRIATEISRALAYLHSAANVSIFHRDIKSSNILLDENLTVKVSDFGASRSIAFEQTHISTNIQGTFGYLDPEYMHTGQLTEKSDVYSLGVILVELLTGEKPTSKARSQDERNLISHFIQALKDNRLFQVVEASITKEGHQKEVEVVAKLAMACLSFRGEQRPTMKDVEVTLDGLRKDKGKKKQIHFQAHEEVESLLHETSTHYKNGSTSMTGSATSLECPQVPSQILFR